MNQKDYMGKLLDLCTEKQRDFFGRMYPAGPTAKQLNWAVTQLENTLKNLNVDKEQLQLEKKAHAETLDTLNSSIRDLEKKLSTTVTGLANAEKRIERLSNPDAVNSAEIQERLALLDALEYFRLANFRQFFLILPGPDGFFHIVKKIVCRVFG